MSTSELPQSTDTLQTRTGRSSRLHEIPEARFSATENESFVMYFFRIVRHRKWTILAALLALPILTYIAAQQMTPLYTAYTTVLFEPRQINIGNIQSLVDAALPDASLESQIEIIKSRSLIQETVDNLGLTLKAEFNPVLQPPGTLDGIGDAGQAIVSGINGLFHAVLGFSPLPVAQRGSTLTEGAKNEAVVRNLLDRLDIQPKGRSSVIEITFTSEDPDLAKEVAAQIANLYIDNQLELKFQSMKRATTWLNLRLDQLRSQVEASEQAVEEFRAQAGLVEGVASALVTEQVSDISRDLVESQTTLAAAEASLSQVRSFARMPGSLESIPEVLQNPAIRELRLQETQLLGREAELAARVGPRHPDLIELRANLAKIRERIFEEVGRLSQGLEAEVRSAQARVDALRNQLEGGQMRATRADAAQIRLRSLEREARANQELLQTFLSRSKELSQQYEIEEPDARILSAAYVSAEPTSPKVMLLLLASIVIGLMVGLLLAYVEEMLDQTFRSSDEVENSLGLPAISIPRIGRSNWRMPYLDYVLLKPSSVFAETVRSLRTLLWLTDLQSKAKLVAITSSRRGEGKTTTAISLARVAALSGESVLIIDCDLSRPMVHTAFKQSSPDNGLSDLLTGRASRREATKTDSSLPNLQYISAGSRSDKLGELLRSKNMIALLRESRNEYDLIVLDTPPILISSDAKVLATMTDAVVYCVAWRSTSRSVANNGIRALMDVGANVMCAALTQVKFSSMRLRDRLDHEAYAAGRASRSGGARRMDAPPTSRG